MKKLSLILLILLFACGPRTGIHELEQAKQKEEDKKTLDPEYLTALQNGKKLFKEHCASCHGNFRASCTNSDMVKFEERLPPPPERYFMKYVLNSEKLRDSGDPYAIKIWEDYGRASMPVFEGILTEVQVAEIYLFIVGSKQ